METIMTVGDLLIRLQALDRNKNIYYEAGDYKDDYRKISSVSIINDFGKEIIVIK
jgi:hypothetical protein